MNPGLTLTIVLVAVVVIPSILAGIVAIVRPVDDNKIVKWG